MHTYLTPAPITVEIRNASGTIHIDLIDTDRTTVDVSLTTGAALGWVDEIVRAFGGRRGENATDTTDTTDTTRGSRWWEAPTGSEADAVLERVRVELVEHDDGARLIVDTDPASRGWRTSFAIRVTAPTSSGIRVAAQSADLTVTGTAGMLDVRSASGDVVAADISDAALVHTASGGIRLQSVGGRLECRSASGDVQAAAVAGAVSLHTTSGDVRLQSTAGDTEVRTVSGDVHIGDLTSGSVQLTAVSGDIEVGVHPGSLAAVSLSTISGDTRSDLTVTDGPAADAHSGESDAGPVPGEGDLAAETGQTEPTIDIRVRTTSGDIRLRRAVSV